MAKRKTREPDPGLAVQAEPEPEAGAGPGPEEVAEEQPPVRFYCGRNTTAFHVAGRTFVVADGVLTVPHELAGHAVQAGFQRAD